MSDENFYQDQTIFAEEEPFHLSSRKKRKSVDLSTVKKPPKLVFIGAAAFTVLLLILGTAMILKNRMPQQVDPLVTASPTPIPQTSSQIDQMMFELRSALNNADPSRTSLPFPPVADQIRINN